MVNIIQDLIPKGRKNRPARTNPMEYITIHNTGNSNKGAGAKNHANYLKSDSAISAMVSWHYTVDDKEIYQHIPDNEDAFHAGDGAGNGNRKSIGIEICMNSDGDILRATNNAVDLVIMLIKKHNIKIENVKQHNNWSGKNCPQLLRANTPYSWSEFIQKVKAELEPTTATDNSIENPDLGLTFWVENGIINSPDYWKEQAKTVKWLGRLINETARFSKENLK